MICGRFMQDTPNLWPPFCLRRVQRVVASPLQLLPFICCEKKVLEKDTKKPKAKQHRLFERMQRECALLIYIPCLMYSDASLLSSLSRADDPPSTHLHWTITQTVCLYQRVLYLYTYEDRTPLWITIGMFKKVCMWIFLLFFPFSPLIFWFSGFSIMDYECSQFYVLMVFFIISS